MVTGAKQGDPKKDLLPHRQNFATQLRGIKLPLLGATNHPDIVLFHNPSCLSSTSSGAFIFKEKGIIAPFL